MHRTVTCSGRGGVLYPSIEVVSISSAFCIARIHSSGFCEREKENAFRSVEGSEQQGRENLGRLRIRCFITFWWRTTFHEHVSLDTDCSVYSQIKKRVFLLTIPCQSNTTFVIDRTERYQCSQRCNEGLFISDGILRKAT